MSSKTVVLRSAIDAWVDTTRPSKTFEKGIRLGLDSGEAYAFVYFARPFPLGAQILAATLHFETAGSWGGTTPTLTVRRTAAKPVFTQLTWNNKPGVTGGTVTASHASTGDRDVWEFNVATLLQDVANGNAWYGFRIETSSTTLRYLRSAQAADGKPTLTVTWAEPPDTPTTLTPSGAVVSIAKPVLTFDYTDLSGATSPAAVQVQINGTNVFTAPSFDSGEVAVDLPRLDLAATAYAGISVAATVYWRVRVKDSSGLWSQWSDGAAMTRQSKGTLTITNPAVSPNDYVQEFSPPITWTFSGTTQESYQVDIVDPTSGGVIYTSGRRTGTALSHTLPADRDAVIANGGTYRVDVYVWDTLDRVATPGDPPHVLAQRTFTVLLDVGTTGVSALAAAVLSPEPGVSLTWTRATAPDSFTVLRNDVVVEANIPPGDVFVTGTSYAYVDRLGRPNVSSTWKVVANVNGKASSASSVAATPKPIGIWLLDLERSLELGITRTDGSTWELGEDGETFVALGASAGVRVTQGIRGWEGTITGALLGGFGGRTLQQWVDEALQMRARPGRPYVLVVGTEAFQCSVDSLVVPPTGKGGIRPVAFNFAQTSVQRYVPIL